MTRELLSSELSLIAGGAVGDITSVYPPTMYGYEIIGWTQQVVGYDSVNWVDYGLYVDRYYEVQTPILDIQPIYAPIVTTTTTTYTYY